MKFTIIAVIVSLASGAVAAPAPLLEAVTGLLGGGALGKGLPVRAEPQEVNLNPAGLTLGKPVSDQVKPALPAGEVGKVVGVVTGAL
ncbi:hypothetical protein NQ176_g8664 [Zarea fungicola]|uniref:Uncharacterized protein n=1 Tax=Zarea fungicola TaxID=93591 RepID=A0ACC1MRJ5_9HYPO|nr:hypothetical protein NQ176_g8664 [Lecanicillium fungicola]